MKRVVILQPAYLPWLGFFDQMRRADVFVYYDDVQFDKNGWRNRNQVKSPEGPHWLTVPVRHSGVDDDRIFKIEIDHRAPWAKKHIGTIKQFYAKAPFAARYIPELEELLNRPWKLLVDLDLAVAELVCRWLGLERQIYRSSELGITGDQSGRLLNICKHFVADSYLSGDAAKNYLDMALFSSHGIQVEWQAFQHPVYSQLHGEFVPFLSALDLLLNEGEASKKILMTDKMAEGKI
ncbi:MAG: WbqC family protein [Candidatus Omnitrophica bacterium]|nr:WbqC family protein [Candidatus Omnitrophota bacterium]